MPIIYHILSNDSIIKATEAELHVYADGTTGDDENDGYTAATPKKTLSAVFALVPDIVKHNTAVHLSGTFYITSIIQIHKTILNPYFLIVSGEEDWTIVDDNTGNKYTSTGSSTSLINVAGAGWIQDEHMGYFLRILSGPNADEIILCQENGTDRAAPTKNFSINPDTNATFEFVKPKTILSGSGQARLLFNCSGGGNLVLQRLTTSGNLWLGCWNSQVSLTYITHVVYESTFAYGCYFRDAHNVYFWDTAFDLETFTAQTGSYGGAGLINAGMYCYYCTGGDFNNFVSKKLVFLRNSHHGTFQKGSRIKNNLIIESCQSAALAKNTTGYAPTKFDSAPANNIDIRVNSHESIDDCEINNAGAHGIELKDNSDIFFIGSPTGSGQAGAGMLAHGDATVLVQPGDLPSFSGAVGDICVLSETEEQISWGSIGSGEVLSIPSEKVLIKLEDDLAEPFLAEFTQGDANATTTSLTAGADYAKLGMTCSLTDFSTNFDAPSTSRLRYTGKMKRKFIVTISSSIETTGVNTLVHVAVAKNGTVDTGLVIDRHLATAADHGAIAFSGIIELGENDYLEMYGKGDKNQDFTVDHFTLAIHEI